MRVVPRYLQLGMKETATANCTVNGQVEMDVDWIKPANYTDISTDFIQSKQTSGIKHQEMRSILFQKPGSLLFDIMCRIDQLQSVIVCERNYTCQAYYLFQKNLIAREDITVTFKQGINSPPS